MWDELESTHDETCVAGVLACGGGFDEQVVSALIDPYFGDRARPARCLQVRRLADCARGRLIEADFHRRRRRRRDAPGAAAACIRIIADVIEHANGAGGIDNDGGGRLAIVVLTMQHDRLTNGELAEAGDGAVDARLILIRAHDGLQHLGG